jgi:aminoglycoside phosphotransferase (APT) family kinase protein
VSIDALLPPGGYVAIPPRGRPLIVASRDAGVLRYLADSVLSVPPGTGSALGLPLTAGLRVVGRTSGSRRADAGDITARTLTELIDEVGGRVACLAVSRDPNAKLTILLFPPGQGRPAYVAKVPTTDAAARSVEREAARLADIAALECGPAVPRIAGHVEHLGHPVLVTTAQPGRSMLAAYHAWHHTARPASVAADYAAAGTWLGALHRSTATGTVSLGSALDGVADAISARFGRGAVADIASLGALHGRLAGHRVPAGVVHGDFWPGNLLIAGGRIRGVIDWEMSRRSGDSTRDLARFVVAYSMYLDRHTRAGSRVHGHTGLRAGRWGAGVEYAMNGTGWYPGLARAFLREGLGRLGVPASCWRDVLLADLAATAAEADHAGFAWNHLMLFRRLREHS